ncbi:helix-turn-helix domain-containing protein [Geodermatophilus amargosae]|uniref:helix-turn-helix domain-containing protein n=1 Tax=Geodermatophilus amargosae TaxID=1296565 RepID=UPI0034DF9FD3
MQVNAVKVSHSHPRDARDSAHNHNRDRSKPAPASAVTVVNAHPPCRSTQGRPETTSPGRSAARGLSQAQLGQQVAELGYPMEQPTVYKLEKGTRPIRVNEIEAVATIFGVDIAELLTPWVNEDHHVARMNLAKAKEQLTEANRRLEAPTLRRRTPSES